MAVRCMALENLGILQVVIACDVELGRCHGFDISIGLKYSQNIRLSRCPGPRVELCASVHRSRGR